MFPPSGKASTKSVQHSCNYVILELVCVTCVVEGRGIKFLILLCVVV
jgi:hypothetical protein